MSKALNITTRTTKSELIEHAKKQLGVELSEDSGRDDLIAAVRDAEKSLGITGDTGSNTGAGTDEDGAEGSGSNDGVEQEGDDEQKPKNPRAAVIEIAQPPSRSADDDEDDEETHCNIGFNGKNFQIQYGEEVEVPWGVYDVLNNAVRTRYKKEFDKAAGKKVLKPYQRKRYTVSLIKKIY